MHRRELLTVFLGAPVGVFIHSADAANDNSALRSSVVLSEVADDLAKPVYYSGQKLVVDTQVNHYIGEGVYLYPSWGSPRPYEVVLNGSLLEFSIPGQQQVLWSQASSGEGADFAGKVMGTFDSSPFRLKDGAGLRWSELSVPTYPA